MKIKLRRKRSKKKKNPPSWKTTTRRRIRTKTNLLSRTSSQRHVSAAPTFQKKPRKAESPSPVALTSRSQSAPRRTLTKGGLAIVSRTENQHRPSPRNAVDLPAFMCAWPCVRFPAFPWVCNCPFACLSVCVWDSVAIWD